MKQKLFNEDGKYNFYIKEAKTCMGNSLGFYDVYMGKKFIGSYNTVKGCKIAISKIFSNICGKENINFIII